jgi:tetratricopeptide (TPR) repeat protein
VVLGAEELHARAVTALNRGRLPTARRLLERARAETVSGDLQARIDGSLAYVLFETGNRVESLEVCRQALEAGDMQAATRGVLLCQIGLVQMLRGEGDEALEAFGEAVPLVTDPQVRGRLHINRGGVHLQRHEVDRAVADFAAAESAYRESGDSLGAAKSAHNLGYALMLDGDLIGALQTMSRAAPFFFAEGPVMAATSDQDMAEALFAAGLEDEGRAAVARASKAYGVRRLYARRGEAELSLARTSLRSDPRAARIAARRAGRLFERTDSPTWRLRAESVEVTAELELGRVAPALVARADALVEALATRGIAHEATALRLRTALALVEAQDPSGLVRVAAIRVPAGAPLDVRLIAREAQAAAATRSQRALAHVRAGLDDLHAWQSSFGSLDLQTNVVGHGVRLAVRGLALAVQSRSDVVLLEWSERARMLASRIQPVRAPQDPQAAADLAELRAGPAPEREVELRRRIREHAWQTQGSGAVSEPVTLPALQAGLGEGTALVAYVVTAARVVALVVTSSGTRRHDLGERSQLDGVLGGLLADLDMAASELPAALAGSVRGTLARRLDAVAALLVEPLLEGPSGLGDQRLVLTPSGVLAGVPWTLLPGLVGRPVTVAQSATSWLARSATPLRTATAGFVAGPRVVRAEAEVRAAAAAWPSAPVLAGPDATASAVSALAGRVDVLHVAAHGRHSAENPLFSGLELVDGTWFGYDIDQLPGVPDVVLLSACEVGRSSVRWGEELIGMTAAWLHAGARCVVASPAAVNDKAAHDVLVRVHESLAAGADPATALAGTVSAVGTDAAPAPFLCFG